MYSRFVSHLSSVKVHKFILTLSGLTFIRVLHKTWVPFTQNAVRVHQKDRLILCRDIIGIYCEVTVKYVNEMRGKTRSFLMLRQFARVGAPSIHLFGGAGGWEQTFILEWLRQALRVFTECRHWCRWRRFLYFRCSQCVPKNRVELSVTSITFKINHS